MAYESGKEVAAKKHGLSRAVTFTLLGVLVCVTLILIIFESLEDHRAISETVISSSPTDMIRAAQNPLNAPATPAETINNFPNGSGVAMLKPFEPAAFLGKAASPDIRRDGPSRKVDVEIAEKDNDHEADATFGPEAINFRNLQLKDENGEIPLDGMEKAREHLKEMQDEQVRRAIAAGKPEGVKFAGLAPGDWAWKGPGNIGGRIRSIVIHPTDPNKMWVGSVGGGIWKTTDAGTTWLPVNDFLANLAVSTMVIDPTNPNVMYAGTGEVLFGNNGNPITGLQGTRGDGIFKSTDGGLSWGQLAQTKVSDPAVCPSIATCPWTFVNRLAISPDGTTLLAATTSGIHRSTDGGATWTPATPLNIVYFDIDFDPTNSQLAIAGSSNISSYTIDGGQNWLTAVYTPAPPGIGASVRVDLAYAPSNPNIVYASVAQNGGEVYRSTTGGQAFTKVSVVNAATVLLATQGAYSNIIWVNPQDPTFVLVGGVDLWKSTDSGQNFARMSRWQNAPTTSAHSDHHIIIAHPGFNNTSNKNVYFGDDGGLYSTNDVSTATINSGWTNMNNGLGITQFYGAAGNSAGVIVGGTQDNGSLKSNANANAWTTTIGGDGGFAAADPTDPNYFYTEYVNLGIQRSTDGGASASYIYCNPVPATGNGGVCAGAGITDAFNGANFVAPFILDPNEPNRMLAGGVSLWRSNDIKAAGLPTWAVAKAPSPTGQPISAISVAKANSDFVVVGHNDGGIFLSQDATSASPSWTSIDSATPARFVTRLAIDETRFTPWIYATFGGFSADNIYRTKDLGLTWTDVTGSGITGLPDVPVRSIVLNPARQDQLYVGTEIGIFASDDAGATWALPQGGPANVSVDELFWNRGNLVAATYGRGIYKTITPSFAAPTCQASTSSCTCAGEWNCGCSWASGFKPDPGDDVYVGCPMTVGSTGGQGVNVRNLRTNGLTLFGNLGIATTEDFFNYGVTESSPNITNGMITARNFYNSGIVSVGTVDVTGNAANGGTMRVGDLFEASKNVITGEQSALSARRVYAGGDFLNYTNAPLVLAASLSVGGNFHTQGRIEGTTLGQAPHFSGAPFVPTYSGPGILKFNGAGTGNGLILANDKTFEVGSFTISGPLNLGTNSMAVTDNTSFTGTGAATGTGTIFLTPRVGVNSVFSYNNANFSPTIRLRSGTAVVTGSSNLLGGPLIIDAGASLVLNSSNLTTNNDVTNNGRITTTGLTSGTSTFYFNGTTLTNNGEVSNIAGQNFFVDFNVTPTTRSQVIAGTGSWSPTTFYIGTGQGGGTTVTLMNDMTFSGGNFATLGAGTFDIGANTFTHAGSSLGGSIAGTGTVIVQPMGGTTAISGSIGGSMRILSGTATTLAFLAVGGPFVLDSGATLTLGNGAFSAGSDVTINGTLNRTSGQYLDALGNGTFLNNGSISADVYLGPFGGTANVVQNLGGAGTWSSDYLGLVSRSTVNLVSNVNFAGNHIYVEGPGVRMNTGTFALSLPCNTVWQGTGEISGNIRRTNLGACPGATLTFGNPFTTIQFTSGTPPTDIRVDTSPVAPVGFLNAVTRSYQITPTGGSGYAATLRLRYQDSELNGNNESTLQLWRFDGSAWTPQGATARDSSNNWVEYAGVTQFSPWAISGLAPTAAGVSISGRVATPDGRGIRNASVSLTDQSGNVRTALTSSFGNYRFDDIQAGQTVVISIAAKRYVFATPTRLVTVEDELADVDFIAEP